MFRSFSPIACVLVIALATTAHAKIQGVYMEARTCDVYTGPCFANAESSLGGKNAIMAWNIQAGEARGVKLSGLSVVMVVRSSNTLGFRGMAEQDWVKSVIIVDKKANLAQRKALVEFVRARTGDAGKNVVKITYEPIAMNLDQTKLEGSVQAGKTVKLVTRKARKDDCICSNESAYYPPLTSLRHFVPGVTIDGSSRARGLGSRWSAPASRSSYMGLFSSN